MGLLTMSAIAAPLPVLPSGLRGGRTTRITGLASVWSDDQTLTAFDAEEDDYFGGSVAIDGDTVVVGASYADTNSNPNSGAAYVFALDGPVWAQQERLIAPDRDENDHLGSSVAIDGDVALVGAVDATVGNGNREGSVYAFRRTVDAWSLLRRLIAPDGDSFDHFGGSVGVSGSNAMVGAYSDDNSSGEEAGSAYGFRLPN